MRLQALAAAAVVAAVSAGCGGTVRSGAGAPVTSPAGAGGGAAPAAATITSPSSCRLTAATRAAIARSQRDLVRLRAVAARQKAYSELGTPAMQLATGRYLDDLTNSPLDGIRVNRLIDLGASVVTAWCGQCFQMLEAARPIPALRYSAHGCA